MNSTSPWMKSHYKTKRNVCMSPLVHASYLPNSPQSSTVNGCCFKYANWAKISDEWNTFDQSSRPKPLVLHIHCTSWIWNPTSFIKYRLHICILLIIHEETSVLSEKNNDKKKKKLMADEVLAKKKEKRIKPSEFWVKLYNTGIQTCRPFPFISDLFIDNHLQSSIF